MKTVSQYPRAVREIMTAWIPMPDGKRLAARIWLPVDAESDPVPAVLEYLPYRRRDGTSLRDSVTQPYLAGHGYAAVRVDIRGTGDSEGLIADEYDLPEQHDGVAVVAWLAAQAWCNGRVGMWGISWGGFNALQVAALQPPALKAIIPMGFTHDRYNGDCHYMGGCMIEGNTSWGGTFFAGSARPPDPAVVGERWRAMWLERLRHAKLPVETWLRHQRRDAYWKPGSVCEDYGRIQAAVYAVNGWQDSYSRNVLPLLEGLRAPKKALIGPWAHNWPHLARPGPAIGFLQEALRWWDHWLKDRDTGIMDEPMLRVWMGEWTKPAKLVPQWPGRWVAESAWPAAALVPQTWTLAGDALVPPHGMRTHVQDARSAPAARAAPASGAALAAAAAPADASAHAAAPTESRMSPEAPSGNGKAVSAGSATGAAAAGAERVLSSPQHTGSRAGYQCSYGSGPDLSDDQRADDAFSLCFDSAPLPERLEILGDPVLELALRSDQPQALVAVRLCEVAPDGASLRVSYGLLNLSHRDSDESPAPLVPGQRYRVRIRLCSIAHAFAAGNRMRVTLSNAYWPIAWPSPAPSTLHIDPAGSALLLPVRAPRASDAMLAPFARPEGAAPSALVQLRSAATDQSQDRIEEQLGAGKVDLLRTRDRGAWRTTDTDVAYDVQGELRFSIAAEDPLSAVQQIDLRTTMGRVGWDVRTQTTTRLSCTARSFVLHATLHAWEGQEEVFSRAWDLEIARDQV